MFDWVTRLFARPLPQGRLHPWILGGVVALILVQIVALSPSSVDERPETVSSSVDPEFLLPRGEKTLASGIPSGKVPDYSVDQFNYVSTQDGVKQWKLVAQQAFLYNHEKLVHARNVKAYLYDANEKVTLVTGLEAKYFMNQRDLEIFGDVTTTFPDGFVLKSPFLRHRPQERKIEIPPQFPVNGDGSQSQDQKLAFDSYGLEFTMANSRITLSRAVQVRTSSPTSETTAIESDRCVIYRDRQLAEFTMSPSRPLDTRFVRIVQPTLLTRSRRTDLNYGNSAKMLNYMVASEDVLIRELSKTAQGLKYATGGKALFDAKRNVIVLTEYPQVYQDSDTVTGEVITLHRDKDIVEVEHSNAYSQGQ
ncbi:MAG: LPS export ABC transporter periplasmic protein LptC [Oligoflexia bacterium]|nr:LPS export ABC transporter periplasmic protein LptC [Oligoflexia bacterium]